MLGRRLDRYVTSFFLWHFVLCLVAVMGLYVLVDTFAHLDDYVEQGSLARQVRWIITYHAYQIPVLIGQFLPIVVLLGGIISLARLAAHNELNATKAAGVSIHRTLLPVFAAALVVGLLGAADQELLVPSLERDIRRIRYATRKSDQQYNDVFTYDEEQRTGVMVERLLNAVEGWELRGIEVSPRKPAIDAPKSPPTRLRAARALWGDRWLFLFDGAEIAEDGTQRPFAHRTLLADLKAAPYAPPLEPQSRLSDGTPARVVAGRLGDYHVDIAFAEGEPRSHLRMFLGGQITSVRADAAAGAPIAITVALWHEEDRQWLGRAQTYEQTSEVKRKLILFDGDPLPLSALPEELIQSRTDLSLKSSAALHRLAGRMPNLRQRVLVEIYSRIAFPLAAVVLLVVAIPLLFQQEGGKSTWVGVGLALVVSLCFYVITYLFHAIGRDPTGALGSVPWLAAWLPTLLFGGAGGVLLWRMDT